MGLSASMWTSVSGLLAHGNKMNLVGNNIANVSTIGFKSQRMDFNDYLYMSGSSASGSTQIGAGVSTYAVLGDYSQGSFESTNSGTDLAIDGNGYFGVRKKGSDQKYYTRAGDFFFNTSRELQNPEGMVVQGWKVNNEKSLTFSSGATNLGTGKNSESSYVGSGSPTDIVLSSWNVPPQRTTNVSFTMGLTNDGDRTTSSTSPMTALFDLWDANSNPPLANNAKAAESNITVYDEGGNKHQLSVYYDQVPGTKQDSDGKTVYKIDGLPEGYTMYEYLVTIPPSEDNRSYGGEGYDEATNSWATEPTKFYNDPINGTSKQAGVLMSGVLVFDSSGQLVNQTAYTYGATETPDANDQVNVDPSAKSSWQPTKFSSNGLPVFTANFTGQPLANSVSETMATAGTSTPFSQAQNYITELNLGLKNISPQWNNPNANTVQLDANGHPVTAGGVSLGVTSYGYYNLANNAYGTNGSGDVFRDNYGFYNTNATGQHVYGIFDDGAGTGPFEVQHDNAGYFYENGGARTDVDINDANITRTEPTTRYTPAVTVEKSSLASLTTQLAQNGTNSDGTPKYESRVSYQNNVAIMSAAERQEGASIVGSSSPITQQASQDGYGSGTLSTTQIDTNGVVWGYYNNDAILPLYQLCLYDFNNYQGLYREGGNLFSATNDSGEPRIGVAGDNGFGTTKAYNIEQSNVDMSREFVQMITTQRGFQANSKGITTVDTMLETVIGMKR